MLYIDKLIECKQRFWYFDRVSAYAKAKELQAQGERVEILKEKGYNWTVFVM